MEFVLLAVEKGELAIMTILSFGLTIFSAVNIFSTRLHNSSVVAGDLDRELCP
jgi:hypothetical protein